MQHRFNSPVADQQPVIQPSTAQAFVVLPAFFVPGPATLQSQLYALALAQAQKAAEMRATRKVDLFSIYN
jgi:hypothetical protein